MVNKTIDRDVTFTREQVAYLERVYGEYPGTPASTDAELRFRSGVRAVVLHIKGRVRDV